ncbi:signal peptidase I [Enterococcus larvae]|uniref:signal peptidase I n=1 Tax=Enterococcus larvae TaxID=2794352 RepID=UPI003F3B20AC
MTKKKSTNTKPRRKKTQQKPLTESRRPRSKTKEQKTKTNQVARKKRKRIVDRDKAGNQVDRIKKKKKRKSLKTKLQKSSFLEKTGFATRKFGSKKVKKKSLYSKKRQKKRRSSGKSIRDFLIITVVTALLFITVSFFFIGITKVQGYSMMPTMKNGDTVLVQKSKKVKRMDIVLFQRGKVQQIRRVIGLPGERISYSDDVLYVDGNVIDEKFIINEINEAQKNGGQYTEDFQLQDISEEQIIPENCYLVLGDNREYGSDSREYGLITSEQIIGVVKAQLLPLNDFSSF